MNFSNFKYHIELISTNLAKQLYNSYLTLFFVKNMFRMELENWFFLGTVILMGAAEKRSVLCPLSKILSLAESFQNVTNL